MLEKDVEKHLVKRVKQLGGIAYKFRSPQNRGVVDRLVVLRGGEVWFVELKRPGGRTSPLQDEHRKDLEALGQRYALLDSIEAVDAWAARIRLINGDAFRDEENQIAGAAIGFQPTPFQAQMAARPKGAR